MSDTRQQLPLPTAVREKLDSVRRRIRAYVWLQTLAMLAITVGCAFWLGMLFDWLFEPSVGVRRMALVAIGCVALFVLYRYLLRRIFVRISDTSAAVLLERRFPSLCDHVTTAVDVASPRATDVVSHPELIAQTHRAAEAAVASVNTRDVFNLGPLVRALMIAAVLAASLFAFAVASREVFGFWMRRIALSEEPWPRRVHLEVVGFEPDNQGERIHKLAQDDDFELLVHASTHGYQVPNEVEIRYRLPDGRRGRDTLTRVGETVQNRQPTGQQGNESSGEAQLFRYEFKHVASDMDFDVVGGDDRVRNLHLRVVDRPELTGIELECVYPSYLDRQPRRLPVTGGMRIPEGTQVVLHAKSTKPITTARIHRAKDKHEKVLTFADDPQQTLDFNYGTLNDDDVLLVTVTDSDRVSTREPYRISLSAVKDEVPQVAVRLAGISTAITPDAILPFVGKITDDYALDQAWFEYQIDNGKTVRRPLAQRPQGQPLLEKIDSFDTRAVDPQTGKRALELKPKQRFTITLKASDRYDLGAKTVSQPAAAHVGGSQPFTLDVVTPSELLALLERRELALRQRFEAIYEKLSSTRDLLARVGSEEAAPKPKEPADANAARKQPAVPAEIEPAESSSERLLSRTRLRVSGSLQNVVQSTDEVTGVAEAFDDLGAELMNNRVDNPDLKSRLGDQIARPLHQIAQQRMPQLVAQLKLVEARVEDPAAMTPELKKSIALADQVLVEMKQVLDRMLELENYNEVVALLRDIITDQNDINRRTNERKKERLRSLFQD